MADKGHRATPEYRAWMGMKSRCYCPSSSSYKNYGGRGIAVCDRWKGSYFNFYVDMGPRPSSDHSLDRIDNDGPYSPENCRWATRIEQNNKTRATRWFTHNGRTMSASDWAREIGISVDTLRHRVDLCGWSVEKALTAPHRPSPRAMGKCGMDVAVFVYLAREEGKKLIDISREAGIGLSTTDRILNKWSVARQGDK